MKLKRFNEFAVYLFLYEDVSSSEQLVGSI